MIDAGRFVKHSEVTTFDKAAAICYKGISQIKVSVMNNTKDEGVIWVMNEKTKETFWMPKSNLDKL
jgi:hypothetical protein